jgi:hypothetical protein
MEFGLERYRTLYGRHGKVELGGFETQQGDIIEPMNEADTDVLVYCSLDKFNTLKFRSN